MREKVSRRGGRGKSEEQNERDAERYYLLCAGGFSLRDEKFIWWGWSVRCAFR